jgi:hypothetical protein
MQLVATLLVLVLAAAAVVTFLELRNSNPQNAPAGALSIEAYQKMVSRHDGLLNVARNNYCVTLQAPCPAPGRPVQAELQRWLDDLNRSQPPARFSVIDSQMRRHLAATIADLNAREAAYQAHDQLGLDRANQEGTAQQHWLDDAATSISDSQQVTAAAYIATVRTTYQTFGGCDACQSLVGPVDCTQIQSMSCEVDVIYAVSAIKPFELELVRTAAPSSLADQDSRLQNDLAQVDTGILAMATARVAGDQAGFNAGRVMLQQALSALKADVTGILGG